nr:MAG: Pentapeptide repeat protein [Bacteriophage sp.]
MSVNWHEDNRKPQEAGSYYTIIEDVTTYDESRQQWLVDEQSGRQVKAWAKIEKPCMPENPYVPEEFRKRLMTYMGRTVGEKSLNTLKSEEQKEKELKEKIDAHSKWLRNAGGERLNLAGADLQGMDLSNTDLRKARLNGANLRATTLYGTNLAAAELADANFEGAKIKDTSFSDADMSSAIFDNAEITDAYFDDANLAYASFINATCKRTSFVGARLRCAKFVNANCRESNFMYARGCAYFKDSDLAGANMRTTMQTFEGGWITDAQAITAVATIVAKGLHSPHTTKKTKRELRALEKLVYRYSQQRKEK